MVSLIFKGIFLFVNYCLVPKHLKSTSEDNLYRNLVSKWQLPRVDIEYALANIGYRCGLGEFSIKPPSLPGWKI